MSSEGRQTLDDENWCVRCGVPAFHCMCPDVGEDGHWWVEPGIGRNRTDWTFCHRCGIIRRADGKSSSTCRGPVRLALRGDAT